MCTKGICGWVSINTLDWFLDNTTFNILVDIQLTLHQQLNWQSASVVECYSIPLIDSWNTLHSTSWLTLNWHSINSSIDSRHLRLSVNQYPWLIPRQHSINTLVDTQLTLHQQLNWQAASAVECQSIPLIDSWTTLHQHPSWHSIDTPSTAQLTGGICSWVSINTLVDSWTTVHQHPGWHLKLTLHQQLNWQSVKSWLIFDWFLWVGQHSAGYCCCWSSVLIEYGSRCWSRVSIKSIKVPMKWNFSPLFYSRKLKSMLN